MLANIFLLNTYLCIIIISITLFAGLLDLQWFLLCDCNAVSVSFLDIETSAYLRSGSFIMDRIRTVDKQLWSHWLYKLTTTCVHVTLAPIKKCGNMFPKQIVPTN